MLYPSTEMCLGVVYSCLVWWEPWEIASIVDTALGCGSGCLVSGPSMCWGAQVGWSHSTPTGPISPIGPTPIGVRTL